MVDNSLYVECPRDGTKWVAKPVPYTYLKKYADEDGLAYPAQVINCPVCYRGYFLEADGVWRSDRDLVVIKDNRKKED